MFVTVTAMILAPLVVIVSVIDIHGVAIKDQLKRIADALEKKENPDV